jgi:regulator of CtrA degradation
MDAVAAPQSKVTAKVIDALYVEAMVLADDARAYFDTFSREDRNALGPVLRVAFSCESLKVTTRLMHIIAWLLGQRSLSSPPSGINTTPPSKLGGPTETDLGLVAGLPEGARTRNEASLDLYARVARLDAELGIEDQPESPARALMDQLSRAF